MMDKSTIKRLAIQTGFTLKADAPDDPDLKLYEFAHAIAAHALEEAAKLCDAKFAARVESGHPREASAAIRLSEQIRALKQIPFSFPPAN